MPPAATLKLSGARGARPELPFDADSFDVVLCQQGLHFFRRIVRIGNLWWPVPITV